MKIEEVKTEILKPYDKNPRINDDAISKVVESIKNFGFQQPIVVDDNFTVIVGHTRLKAAKELNLGTVPVIVASNLTKEQVKAYRLADNKVAEFAEWDMELLGDELKDILSGENLFTGFDDFETESILIGLEDTEQGLEDYVQPEEDGIKLGTCPECHYKAELSRFS